MTICLGLGMNRQSLVIYATPPACHARSVAGSLAIGVMLRPHDDSNRIPLCEVRALLLAVDPGTRRVRSAGARGGGRRLRRRRAAAGGRPRPERWRPAVDGAAER